MSGAPGEDPLADFGFEGEDWLDRLRAARAGGAGERVAGFEDVVEMDRGGQGVVYRAWDPEAHRLVALKRLPDELRSDPERAARFEREIEATCSLSHPYVVTVYGIQRTEDGALLVMEWVEGKTLTRWAHDLVREKSTLRARLDMVVRIAEGLQHAHERGVVHRDLKPENVLVEESGRPRLVDFGVAKRLDPSAREIGPTTGRDQFVGTLGYCAPERLSPGAGPLAEVRADVFSLGVILYELLTGRLPWELRGGAEELAQEMTRTALVRPSALASGLEGELDAIAAKALAIDPRLRYSSARELAEDLERTLRGEPVAALRAHTGYRARKLLQRHRLAIGTAALAVAAGAWAWHALSGARSRGSATAAVNERLKAVQQDRAALESAVLDDLFDAAYRADEEDSPQSVQLVARMLRKAVAEHELQDGEDPATDVALRLRAGQALAALHATEDAARILESTLSGLRKSGIEQQDSLRQCLSTLGRLEYARRRGRQAVVYQREVLQLTPEAPSAGPRAWVGARLDLARTLAVLGESEDARHLVDEVLALASSPVPLDAERRVDALLIRARLESDAGELKAAQATVESALELARSAPRIDPTALIDVLEARAGLAADMGLNREAEPDLRQALALRERHCGAHHPLTQRTRCLLSGSLLWQSKLDEAAELAEAARAGLERTLPEGEDMYCVALENLADIQLARGDTAAAARIASEAADRVERGPAEEYDIERLRILSSVGRLLHRCGETERGRSYVERAIDILESRADLPLDLAANAKNTLAQMLRSDGRLEDALMLTNEVIDLMEQGYPEGHGSLVILYNNRGNLRLRSRDLAGAEADFRSAWRTSRRLLGPLDRDTDAATWNLANTLILLDRPAEAESILVETLEVALRAGNHERSAYAYARMAELRLAQRNAASARENMERAAEQFELAEGTASELARSAATTLQRMKADPEKRDVIPQGLLVMPSVD